MKRITYILSSILFCVSAFAKTEFKPMLSTWYWLNAVPSNQWEKDFKTMKDMGLTQVVLWYGWDTTLVAREIARTKLALDACQKAGMKAMLGVWSSTGMDPKNDPKLVAYKLVDETGRVQKGFNIFNATWRHQWMVPYLERISASYKAHPALEGYYMDGAIGIEDVTKAVSFSNLDYKQFGEWLKTKAPTLARSKLDAKSLTAIGTPLANEWVKAKSSWVQEWADQIRSGLRVDETHKKLVFSDFQGTVEGKVKSLGAEWKDILSSMSGAMLYGSNVSPAGFIKQRIDDWRAAASRTIPMTWGMFTFILNGRGSADLLSEKDLIRQLQEAKSARAHIDLYAFRLGDWSQPYSKIKNPLEGPPANFKTLVDRPDLHKVIKRFADGKL